jgi:hypothetical protein
LEINFPTSEVNDAEASARALLGVKHGSTNDVLGIPNSEIAKKMGFGNYRKLRLQHASEADRFPNLVANMNAEAMQEKLNAEPPVMNKPGGQGNEQKQKDQGQGQEGQKPGQKRVRNKGVTYADPRKEREERRLRESLHWRLGEE